MRARQSPQVAGLSPKLITTSSDQTGACRSQQEAARAGGSRKPEGGARAALSAAGCDVPRLHSFYCTDPLT